MVSSAGWTIAKGTSGRFGINARTRSLNESRPHAAATIAIRYTTVRRQGSKDSEGLERQVITYPSVYYRLLPALAHAYVFVVLGRNLVRELSIILTAIV